MLTLDQSTRRDRETDLVLCAGFCFTLAAALWRAYWTSKDPRAGVTVTVYVLTAACSLLRAVWFGLPSDFFHASYDPSEVRPWVGTEWLGILVSNAIETAGSILLFSVFSLIILVWSDLLERVFGDALGPRRSVYGMLAGVLASMAAIKAANDAFFVFGGYSFLVLLVVDAVTFTTMSLAFALAVSVLSYRMRTVLLALSDVSQLPTSTRVHNITMVTVSCNLFFALRVGLEVGMCYSVLFRGSGSAEGFVSREYWYVYVLVKYLAEVCVLALLMHILHVKPEAGYESVSDSDSASSSPPPPQSASL